MLQKLLEKIEKLQEQQNQVLQQQQQVLKQQQLLVNKLINVSFQKYKDLIEAQVGSEDNSR